MGERRCGRAYRLAAVALIAMAPIGAANAQPEDPGHFEVRTAWHEPDNGVIYISGLMDLRLSTDASEALHSTFTLTIVVEIEFLNRLRLWWDLTAESVRLRFQLRYIPLTGRYVVRNVNASLEQSFPTLRAALDYIGNLDRIPALDASLLDDDRRYDIRVRALLDRDELTGPLGLMAFWRSEWSIKSEWFRWGLDD